MVLADMPQLTQECNVWRDQLHAFRDEFKLMQQELQKSVNHNLSKKQQEFLEHYQNQLHIQLINIHDLKQTVKAYEVQLQKQQAPFVDEQVSQHANLQNDYLHLSSDLSALRQELLVFVEGVKN